VRAIFLSYRRDDAEGEAGRLFDDLVHEFGADKVFMDVAGIEPGRDFRKVIDQNVSSCGVLLAMMGKGWIDAKDESGRRRLDDPLDFVRLETASALKRDIPVIPVLVHGGRIPRSEQLPDDLRDLAYRNGVELTHARWDSDVQLLIKALRPHVSGEQKGAGGIITELLDSPSVKSTARASGEAGVGGPSSAAPIRAAKKSWRGVIVAAAAAIVIAAGVIGAYEYIKAEEGRVREAAARAAAKQSVEDQRMAAEKEAARRAAEQEAADQAAARRAAAVITVVVRPQSITLEAGRQVKFSALVTGTSNRAVRWSKTGPGTLMPDGTYQAPAVADLRRMDAGIQAISEADQTKTAIATVTLQPFMFLQNTNFFGGDLDHVDYRGGDAARQSPEKCYALCVRNERCRAFTFARPSSDFAQCWLKSSVPQGRTDATCVSGVVRPGQ